MKKFLPQLSLSSRLCALISVSMLIVMTVISGTSYYLLNERFDSAASKFLKREIFVISALLKDHSNHQDALNQEVVWRPEGNRYEFLVQISTSDRKLLRRTPTMVEKFRGTAWPAIALTSKTPYSDMTKINKDGHVYQLMTGLVNMPAWSGRTYIIKIAYDVTQHQNILNTFLIGLILINLLGMFVVSMITFGLVRFGLSPLKNFVRFLSRIDPKKHNEPVDVKRLPKELKPLAESFNTLLEKMEISFEQLSTFSSNIAHELRTPINNLMLETEITLNRIDHDPEQLEHLLQSSMEEYQRLSKIIEKLLFLARAESNNLSLAKTELNLFEELNKVAEFLQAFADEKNMKIVIHGMGKLQADSTLLRQAFSNILTNAIKYGNKNTDIEVVIHSDDKFINVHFINDGPEITDEHLKRIADRFYRIDTHRSSKTGGVGLGLSIVQSIVKMHGGELKFTNKHQGRIRVSLVFPRGSA